MAHLTATPSYRHDAVEDAKSMQQDLERQGGDIDQRLQNYQLSELIGKGSFGRVYKAIDGETGNLVAVKVISIEDSDQQDRHADTLGDIRKEIETLRALSGSGAKNISSIIDDFLVGSSICMVTELCAGGSVSTLMKPIGSVPEKWIIPILREASEGLAWVHKRGIIHRDIKCANVLVNDDGRVQLCDFGVAGIVETKHDKRNTFIGTLHWMAPEMFDSDVEYGKEVDIWAFGSLAFEAATGLPPNARLRNMSRLGSHLRQKPPRLDGDQYSPGLKDFVAFCLTEDRSHRPSIEDIQKHSLISGSAAGWPTSSLVDFVQNFKLWESQGGSRTSLFSAGGAQRQNHQLAFPAALDDWDFDEWAEMDMQQLPTGPPEVTIDSAEPGNLLARRRRRAPPIHTEAPTAPLEQLFDSHTLTGYDDYSRDYYQGLPLRSGPGSEDATLRESLIDLDEALVTIKPRSRAPPGVADASAHRQTLEWKFPHAIPSDWQPDQASSPPLPYETNQMEADVDAVAFDNRQSTLSLIDLDDCLPSSHTSESRPSTARSEPESAVSDIGSYPFDLERTMKTSAPLRMRDPSIYVEDRLDLDIGYPTRMYNDGNADELLYHKNDANANTFASTPSSPSSNLPPLPEAPSSWVMEGRGSDEDMKAEMRRMLSSFGQHLGAMSEALTLTSSDDSVMDWHTSNYSWRSREIDGD